MKKHLIKKKYVFLGEVNSINIELIIKYIRTMPNKLFVTLFFEFELLDIYIYITFFIS